MEEKVEAKTQVKPEKKTKTRMLLVCLLYTSPSPRD